MRIMPVDIRDQRARIEHARSVQQRKAAERRAADPAQLAKAARTVQAGLRRRLITVRELVENDSGPTT